MSKCQTHAVQCATRHMSSMRRMMRKMLAFFIFSCGAGHESGVSCRVQRMCAGEQGLRWAGAALPLNEHVKATCMRVRTKLRAHQEAQEPAEAQQSGRLHSCEPSIRMRCRQVLSSNACAPRAVCTRPPTPAGGPGKLARAWWPPQ